MYHQVKVLKEKEIDNHLHEIEREVKMISSECLKQSYIL